jgi:hypothetical protein
LTNFFREKGIRCYIILRHVHKKRRIMERKILTFGNMMLARKRMKLRRMVK